MRKRGDLTKGFYLISGERNLVGDFAVAEGFDEEVVFLNFEDLGEGKEAAYSDGNGGRQAWDKRQGR